MVESAKDYAERVLAYCMKATKQIPLNDPSLKQDTKKPVSESSKDGFDESFEAMYKMHLTNTEVTGEKPSITEYLDNLMKEDVKPKRKQ